MTTSDAAEYQEQRRYIVIDRSVKQLRGMQGDLRRIFGEVVRGGQWTDFNAAGLKAYADKNDWDMIVSNPDQLGQPIMARQKDDVSRTAHLLGQTLLKQTGYALIDTPVAVLREKPAQLGDFEKNLEEVSAFCRGGEGAEATAESARILTEGVRDMVDNNTGLSARAARAFDYKPVVVDVDEKRLGYKRMLLDVAQMWAELSMLETRVMRTALLIDMGYEKNGMKQTREERGVILSSPTQSQFVLSDQQAFTGLARARQTLSQALTHY